MGIDDRTRTAPAPPSADTAARYPLIWMMRHPDPRWIGQYRPLESGADLTLGRAAADAFGGAWRDDELASRNHARVVRTGSSVQIEDLDSRNGTWLDGKAVTEATWSDGQSLRIGGAVLLLRWSELPTAPESPDPRWVGVGPAHAALVEAVNTVAPLAYTVLIRGETGVGKDVLANAIHRQSGRTGAFVAINCAGVGDGVLQSELFGHTRGAYTGAETTRAGLVEAAAGGTLFLDEIGDASQGLQAALLRLLENGEYRQVGSDRVKRASVRVVAATHRDLGAMAAAGTFRADLLGRLNRWSLELSPLRDRPEDLAALVPHFARSRAVGVELMEQLIRHPWPGNVRELSALVERLCAITPESSPLDVAPWLDAPVAVVASKGKRRKRADREELVGLLDRHAGNVKAIAAELGIGRNTLYAWLTAAGLDPTGFR